MVRQAIRELLRYSAGPHPERTAECPDEHELTAALNGSIPSARRESFEVHVADCDYCIARLGQLARVLAATDHEETPETTRARAEKLVPRLSTRPQVFHWAAAAVVVLAVTFTAWQFGHQPDGVAPPSSSEQKVRNINPGSYRLEVLYPDNGTTIATRRPVFRWSEVPGSIHYNVRIVSDDGTMIRQDRVEDAEWRLPGDLKLASTEEYYFRVDAYLTEAKSVSSRHVLFTVGGRD